MAAYAIVGMELFYEKMSPFSDGYAHFDTPWNAFLVLFQVLRPAAELVRSSASRGRTDVHYFQLAHTDVCRHSRHVAVGCHLLCVVLLDCDHHHSQSVQRRRALACANALCRLLALLLETFDMAMENYDAPKSLVLDIAEANEEDHGAAGGKGTVATVVAGKTSWHPPAQASSKKRALAAIVVVPNQRCLQLLLVWPRRGLAKAVRNGVCRDGGCPAKARAIAVLRPPPANARNASAQSFSAPKSCHYRKRNQRANNRSNCSRSQKVFAKKTPNEQRHFFSDRTRRRSTPCATTIRFSHQRNQRWRLALAMGCCAVT